MADLAAIVEEVKHDYKVDPNRIHIAGISSGGAMTVAALVAYSEIFASGSPTAGVPYSETEMDFMLHMYKPVDEIAAAMTAEMGANKWPVPILIIQSEADETVNPSTPRTSATPGERRSESIRKPPFLLPSPIPPRARPGRTRNTEEVLKATRLSRLCSFTPARTAGLKHGWYGDGDAQFAFSNAPDTTQLVWEFFKAHPMPPSRHPDPAAHSSLSDSLEGQRPDNAG